MDLLVACGVEEHAVGCLVVTAFGPPHDVMAVPSRQGGDLLAADRTESPLFLPQTHQDALPGQGPDHLHVQTTFEVRFPGGVVRIGLSADLQMTLDACLIGRDEMHDALLVCAATDNAAKDPPMGAEHMKVPVLHPPARLVAVSPHSPGPQCRENGMIHGVEDSFAHDVPVIERLPTNEWVDLLKQVSRRLAAAVFDPLPDRPEERLDALLGWRDVEFSSLLTAPPAFAHGVG